MAIKDTTRKPYIQDNDNNVFIGIDLPIRLGTDKQGFFASTTSTIEAVKNNIRNLLNTHKGERLMHPNMGLNLRNLLFEPNMQELDMRIQSEITDLISYWLPFVTITEIDILTADNDLDINQQTIRIDLSFFIKEDPNTLDSIQVTLSPTANQDDSGTMDSVGTY